MKQRQETQTSENRKYIPINPPKSEAEMNEMRRMARAKKIKEEEMTIKEEEMKHEAQVDSSLTDKESNSSNIGDVSRSKNGGRQKGEENGGGGLGDKGEGEGENERKDEKKARRKRKNKEMSEESIAFMQSHGKQWVSGRGKGVRRGGGAPGGGKGGRRKGI